MASRRSLGLTVGAALAIFAVVPLFQNFTPSTLQISATAPAACNFVEGVDTGDKPADIRTLVLSAKNAKTTKQVISNGQTLTLPAIELDSRCSYKALELQIRSSNLLLDCKGANFDGAVYPGGVPDPKKYVPVPKTAGFVKFGAIGIRVYNPADKVDKFSAPLQNVFVRNCNFKNYATGARVQNGYAEDLTNSGTDVAAVTLFNHLDILKDAVEIQTYADSIRLHSPHGVEFSHLTIQGSAADGVQIGRFVSGVSISDSVIENGDGVGVYVSPSASGNVVKNNNIRWNGYRGYARGITDKGAILGMPREGLALDSAPRNLVSGNAFTENAGGGVYLYKNCAEGHGWKRPEGANGNRIAGNVFTNLEIGVWIASRQSMNLDPDTWKCNDESPYARPNDSHFLDYAANTVVSDNTFRDVATGVRIEDDGAEVVRNIFEGNSSHPLLPVAAIKRGLQNFSVLKDGRVWGVPVYAGTAYRAKYYPGHAWPVEKPVVRDNSTLGIQPVAQKLKQGLYLEAFATEGALVTSNFEGCRSNGNLVRSGESVNDYKEEFVKRPEDCRANKRSCVDGALSNYSADYKFGSCTVANR